METIVEITRSNTAWIAVYALLITLALIIIVNSNSKRKKRYIDWKKQTLNIYLLKIEWERNDDELLNELFSENEHLLKENKVLKQNLTKSSILNLIFLISIVVKEKFKKG